MNIHKGKLISFILVSVSILMLLCSCSQKKQLTLEEQLICQIDHESDDYLFSLGNDWKDNLTLKSIFYQGIVSSEIQLFEMSQKDWIQKEIPQISLYDDCVYSISDDMHLHIFQRESDTFETSKFHYLTTLTWDSLKG